MSVSPSDLPVTLIPFLAKGWAIFPVRGKEPLTPHGFKDASKDPEQWLRWLREFPGCGWGAPTGEVNGFDVLDGDTPEAVADGEARLPAGPRVRTGRGMHFHIKHEQGARNWAKRIPGCDFRGEGGYVVLPGSIHENGQPYEWVEGTADLPLPDAPEWLREVSQKAPEASRSGLPYKEGERNDRLFKMACAIRAKGHDVLPELRRNNAELCAPPLEDAEVVRIAESASRYLAGSGTDAAASREPLFSTSGEPERAAFVEEVMARYPFATLQDNEELLVYRDGQYVTGAQQILKGWIEDQFRDRKETARTGFVAEIIAATIRRTFVPRDEFNPPGSFCLANGVLDVSDPARPILRPHGPRPRFTTKMPVAFDPRATCPAFDKFLAEVLPVEADRTEVRKMFGYCLVSGNPLQIAFMFIGEGANGKSTLLNVLGELLGEESVSAETLQSLVTNRFAPAKLWGKKANICADIPANPLPFTGTLKTLTGGDKTRAENKFGQPFYFTNGAKLIFSANELPEVNDRTRAFWRRWFMVRFTETFIGKEDRKLPERLKAELSGILNFALQGLADLQEDGEFKPTQTSEDLALEWKQRADPVYWFASTRLEKIVTSWISKENLYEAYVQFCETHGCAPKKEPVFGKILPTYAPWIRTERKTIGPKPSVRGWLGVRLRDDPEVESSPNLTGWAGKTGSLTSAPGHESTLEVVDGPGTEVELPAQPVLPVKSTSVDENPSGEPGADLEVESSPNLTGWAGKTGSPTSVPGRIEGAGEVVAPTDRTDHRRDP